MRDLFLVAAVAISLIWILRYAFVGVLMWEWFAVMNPHQETYGFARTLPLNLLVAGTPILSWLVSPEPKKIPRSAIVTPGAAPIAGKVAHGKVGTWEPT